MDAKQSFQKYRRTGEENLLNTDVNNSIEKLIRGGARVIFTEVDLSDPAKEIIVTSMDEFDAFLNEYGNIILDELKSELEVTFSNYRAKFVLDEDEVTLMRPIVLRAGKLLQTTKIDLGSGDHPAAYDCGIDAVPEDIMANILQRFVKDKKADQSQPR